MPERAARSIPSFRHSSTSGCDSFSGADRPPSQRPRTSAALQIASIDVRYRGVAQPVLSPRFAAKNHITLAAMKFEFSKKEIRVRKGERVMLVLAASDFVHGFSVSDFNVRTDIPPGKAVELTFVPDKTGRFVCLCDNLCGESHDRMSGAMIVTE